MIVCHSKLRLQLTLYQKCLRLSTCQNLKIDTKPIKVMHFLFSKAAIDGRFPLLLYK